MRDNTRLVDFEINLPSAFQIILIIVLPVHDSRPITGTQMHITHFTVSQVSLPHNIASYHRQHEELWFSMHGNLLRVCSLLQSGLVIS
jgi:hypothetical protein